LLGAPVPATLRRRRGACGRGAGALPSGLVNPRTDGRGRVCPRAAFVVAAALVAGGCAWDGPMSTVVARSDLNRSILHVYGIITWATLIIGLVVFTVLAVVLLRFRARPGDTTLPTQIRGHTAMEIGWTIAPALILLVIAIPTIQVIFRTQSAAAPRNALEVSVRGWQW